MIHLTYTGPDAGTPLCGADREAETGKGARFCHAAYAPPAIFNAPDICTDCVELWDRALDEED